MTRRQSRLVGRTPPLRIRRRHGLGNLICLLPVLDLLREKGRRIELTTRTEWLSAMSQLRPGISWTDGPGEDAVDLDSLTGAVPPAVHRTDEFGRLLRLPGPFDSPRIEAPRQWAGPFEHLRDCIIFAPEATHASRCWPMHHVEQFCREIDRRLVLVGTSPTPEIQCDVDTRAQLQLEQLIGLLSIARAVVSMDSAVLHIAAALGVPTVALFGGVDPSHRIRSDQPVVALQTDIACCPCNKHESCDGEYPCIASIEARDVIGALEIAAKTSIRVIHKVQPRPVGPLIYA